MIKIVEGFVPQSGKHCITNSLKQIFAFHGFEISEAMLFGLGSGLSWFYMENKAVPFPIISGRTKPLDFENGLSENTGIKITVNKTSSVKKAWAGLQKTIEYNKPVMLYADMACLNYLNMPKDAHFGGHSVVVYGIDEVNKVAYVSDRDGKDNLLNVNGKILDNDYYLVSFEELSDARNSKHGPFPAQNKWLEFDFNSFIGVTPEMIHKAISKNLEELLNPPIKNLSISGIEKFSKAILKWREFSDVKLKASAINSFFMIDERGGTGGAAFRKMYADFLQEASIVCNEKILDLLGKDYLSITEDWNILALGLWKLYETSDRTLLKELSKTLKIIATGEYDALQKIKKFVYGL
jgi:hypothetical protein